MVQVSVYRRIEDRVEFVEVTRDMRKSEVNFLSAKGVNKVEEREVPGVVFTGLKESQNWEIRRREKEPLKYVIILK